jgi:hypothetical protein
MRNREIILTTPKESAREKKVSAFKTLSFLESFPENEPGSGFSDYPGGDECPHAQVPHP